MGGDRGLQTEWIGKETGKGRESFVGRFWSIRSAWEEGGGGDCRSRNIPSKGIR